MVSTIARFPFECRQNGNAGGMCQREQVVGNAILDVSRCTETRTEFLRGTGDGLRIDGAHDGLTIALSEIAFF
jgi:hypothetical protein